MKSSKYNSLILARKGQIYLFQLADESFFLSDIEDVNKAFQEMHEEVEQKVYRGDLDTALQSQQTLNEVLC